MKKWMCLILALLLSGCTAAPAETEPVLSGSLTVSCLEGAVLLQCNGETALVDCSTTPEVLKSYGVESLSAVILTGSREEASLEPILEAFPTEVIAPEKSQTLYLDCARLTVHVPRPDCRALEVRFGDQRFWFLGSMPGEAQKTLAETSGEALRCQILHFRNTAEEALLSAAAPDYLLVDGRADEALKERFEVFDTRGFGPITAESDGSSVNLSWTIVVTDSAAVVPVQPAP